MFSDRRGNGPSHHQGPCRTLSDFEACGISLLAIEFSILMQRAYYTCAIPTCKCLADESNRAHGAMEGQRHFSRERPTIATTTYTGRETVEAKTAVRAAATVTARFPEVMAEMAAEAEAAAAVEEVVAAAVVAVEAAAAAAAAAAEGSDMHMPRSRTRRSTPPRDHTGTVSQFRTEMRNLGAAAAAQPPQRADSASGTAGKSVRSCRWRRKWDRPRSVYECSRRRTRMARLGPCTSARRRVVVAGTAECSAHNHPRSTGRVGWRSSQRRRGKAWTRRYS